MGAKGTLLRSLKSLALTPVRNSGYMFVQVKHKTSSLGRRPKKKIYYRVHELDKVMDHQKKPGMILQLKNIIQSQKGQSILIRDLEKEVGIVHKWNLMAVIEKYPSIFRASGGKKVPISISLTEKARNVAEEENEARSLMEPIVANNLRKLLMLTVDCRVPLEKIEFIQRELGLPDNFQWSFIPKYEDLFTLRDVDGKAYLILENWDSSLAVTAREEKLAEVANFGGNGKKPRISKDGNYCGPHAFQICYPSGFRPNMSYLEELQRWQRLDFPSPYLNGKKFESADPKARKRVVAVLHELLSLTMEKRMTSAQMDVLRPELLLPSRLLLCLIKHHGIFYITNKGARSTVFLKEAYSGSDLIEKCPLLRFNDKFVALCGRRDTNLNANDGFPVDCIIQFIISFSTWIFDLVAIW
ncbi:hypothetical protein V2J09_001248 [Rumex salicifolius]